MMNDASTWRSILARDVAWRENPISQRAGGAISHMCFGRWAKMHEGDPDAEYKGGAWADKTLGDIADMGVRRWKQCIGIGDQCASVIKWAIDRAAEGKCPMLVGIASDAYVPACERETSPIGEQA
jgi:hypothetical protein